MGPIGSPYIGPNFHNRRFLDTQYGIRKASDSFMIVELALLVDTDSDITINGHERIKETVDTQKREPKLITTDDLKNIRTY